MSSEDLSKRFWNEYKQSYKLLFNNQEETRRFKNFVANNTFIEYFNKCRYNNQHHTVCGHNQFSHLNDQEYRALLTVKCCAPTERRAFMNENETHIDFVPCAFDWRDYNVVCEVKNQGLIGTSWAFSAVAAIESSFARVNDCLIPLSEQQIIDCCDTAFGRYGGLSENVFEYVKENGIMHEKSYPYEGNQGPKRYKRDEVVYIHDYYSLRNSESALECATFTLGPVSVAINASSNSFRFYKRGLYFDPHIVSSSESVDHALLCVGFEYGSQDMHWILKNSWGTEWGEQGYVRFLRNGQGFGGITQLASVPIV